MITTLFALIPVMFLIALGYMLRSRNFIDAQFWLPCEKLNYFWLFPALMFSQVATADLGCFRQAYRLVYPWGSTAGSIVSLGLAGIKQTVRSCIFFCHTGALRPNTYIGVAAAAATYGTTGLTVTSISIAVAIPL